MKTTVDDFTALLDKQKGIALKKNSDYAGEKDFLGNFKMSKALGIKPSMGIVIRLSDKWSRLCQLIQKDEPAVVEESIEDTLLDIANYSLLMILALREEK